MVNQVQFGCMLQKREAPVQIHNPDEDMFLNDLSKT